MNKEWGDSSSANGATGSAGGPTADAVPSRPKVLCIDDETAVLDGLRLTLRKRYEVLTAASGQQALESMDRNPDVEIVVCDMRMPGMDGAAVLAKIRERAPDTVRLLLTGQADMESAAQAVNEGQLFRFLLKPCSPDVLLTALAAATEQRRLLIAEKELLGRTLQGTIRALTEILAMVHPHAFGRAVRLRELATRILDKLGAGDRWAVEVAAMLSQIGWVTSPPGVVERFQSGSRLTLNEQRLVEEIPGVSSKILGRIPRLEPVEEILNHWQQPFDAKYAPSGTAIPLGARLLKLAADYDLLESQGIDPADAIEALRGRQGRYDPALLEVLVAVAGSPSRGMPVREIPIRAVRVGMVFVQDVRTQSGALLVSRGHEVTPALAERLRNMPPNHVREPVRVAVKEPNAR